jgi:hypothetical protein
MGILSRNDAELELHRLLSKIPDELLFQLYENVVKIQTSPELITERLIRQMDSDPIYIAHRTYLASKVGLTLSQWDALTPELQDNYMEQIDNA